MKTARKENQIAALIHAVLAAVLLLSFVSVAGASFEDTEIGAKATSMAGAFVSQADDISCLFYNPAGLVLLENPEALASYEKKYWGLDDDSNIKDQLVAFGMPAGKAGNFGLAWHVLALDSLYEESLIRFGYAHRIKGGFYGGVSAASLSLKYGETKYTKINPVFDNGYNTSAVGVDAGILYEGAIVNWGLSVLNINEPDLGLKYKNKIPRKINVGVSIKQKIINLNMAGVFADSKYKIKTGVETWLYKRNIAVRGGLNIGSLKYRNAAVGMGYRDSWYEVDYAFTYPLSGIAETYGSHQISVVFRWGKKEEEPEFTWKDLINIAKKEQPERPKKEEKKEEEEMAVSPEDIVKAQEYIIGAKEDFAAGEYSKALENVQQAKDILKDDQEVKELLAKGASITGITGSITAKSRRGRLLRKSLLAYVSGNGKQSIEAARYASQLYKSSKLVGQVRKLVEGEFQSVAESEKLVPGIDLVNQKLQEALELIYDGKYVAAISLCKEVLELAPNNVLALMRMGSAYWAMGHTDTAKEVWRKALKYDPNNKQLIEFLKMEKKGTPKAAPAKPLLREKTDEQTKKEYENGVNYYERVKRYGANADTLKSILIRMIDKFKDTAIDISYLRKELKKYQ